MPAMSAVGLSLSSLPRVASTVIMMAGLGSQVADSTTIWPDDSSSALLTSLPAPKSATKSRPFRGSLWS